MNSFNFFQQFGKRLIELHQLQHRIRMYIFSNETYFLKSSINIYSFLNGVSINFLFRIPFLFFSLKFFCLSTSSLFNLNFVITHQLHYYLSTWVTSLWSLESSYSLQQVFDLLAISCRFWMLQMLITVYMAKFTFWKTLKMLVA